MGVVSRALCAAAAAALLYRCGDPHISAVPTPDARLGDTTYRYHAVEAPAATGTALSMLGALLTKTPIGPLIRRHLLDTNQVATLRTLGAQTLLKQPLTTPIRRLGPAARAAHEAGAAAAARDGLSLDGVLRHGIPGASANRSRIEAYHAAFKSGALDPVEAARRVLAALRRLQRRYVPFAEVNEKGVLAQAEASAARWRSADGPLSVLDGVPVAVKDMIDTKGHLTSDGSASNAGNPKAADDDAIVSRLRELGAVVLGTTVMTEGGVTPLGYSVHFRGPFNPRSNGADAEPGATRHYPGGSSSGSAVAVALGLCPIAVGFDGGGSIRIPASFSGVVGLAASYGRVDFTASRAISNVKAGPLAATAADAAVAFLAMSRPAPPDGAEHAGFADMYDGGSAAGRPTAHLGGFNDVDDLTGVRLGVFQPHFDDCDAGVRAVCAAAVAALERRGATVEPMSIPNLGWLRLAHAVKISTEFASGWDTKYSAWADMEPNTRVTVGLGLSVTAVEALACDRLRAWAFENVTAMFEELNLTAIVSPTLPMSAPKIPEGGLELGESNTKLVVEMMKFIFLANFLGLPAISVPAGADESNDGMPVGLQFLGPHWSEHSLLRLARAVEVAVPPVAHTADRVDVLAGRWADE